MGVSRNIDITARQRKTILELLGRYLPNVTVWVYGSRVRWTSRPQSDLDMVAFASPEQKSQVAALKEAFEESDLPFRVDLFVWDEVPEQFRKNIEAEHVVLVEEKDEPLGMGGDSNSGWETIKLGEFITLQRGIDLPTQNRKQGEVPILGSFGITGWHNEAKAKGPGITVGRSGASFGTVSYSTEDYWPLNTALYVKDFHGNDPRFAYYFLTTFPFKQYNSGSAQPSLNRNFVHPVSIRIPPLSEQKRIAAVLGALDDKIELNRKMNKTLEAMAQAIFRSWFVDFEPFRDGGMIDSELGPIPKGWKVMALDKVAEFLNGAACQKYPAIADKDSLPVIKIRELSQGVTQQTDRVTASIPAKWIVEDGDILFSWSGSLMVKIWTGGKGALNQHLFKVASKQFPKWFYYLWTKYHLEKFQGIAADKATTMGHIKRKNLSDAKVVVPPSEMLKELGSTLSPLIQHKQTNDIQSRTLAELRDALLPKLISGEIRIPEVSVEN